MFSGNGEKMKANCKKWKGVLFITAASVAFSAYPFGTAYANIAYASTVSEGAAVELNATQDKANSLLNITNNIANGTTQNNQTLLTAGAGDILDADLSLESDELEALVQSRTVQAAPLLEDDETDEEESLLVMANVNQYVNIRLEPNADSEKVGVLYKDCGGTIIEQDGEWTKITSGDVTGWVKSEYLYFGEEAQALAEDVGMLTAYVDTATLRVRKEASLDSGILGLLAEGEAVEAIAEEGDWVSISYEGETGYVAAEYVNLVFDIDKAESMEVIKAREEEAKAQAAAEAAAKLTAQKEAVLATASEVDILAALIQCEAGGEVYEGQLAVGAVVMNRVRSAGYPNTIAEVIYASGQFTPASKGKMETLILNGTIKDSCRQAATEAINGACNIGDALHFRRNNGRDGIVIGNHVFY